MEKILSDARLAPLEQRFGRRGLKEAVNGYLERVRSLEGEAFSFETLLESVASQLEQIHRFSLRRVVNATGVLIHTNLGRSPIEPALWQRAGRLLEGYSNLEYDIEGGERGSRHRHLDEMASRLFGCEAALLTNNNAGAIMLVLAASASGKEVIVSRGELVEIGGEFRIPDVIQQGGARLREVGTTNRTRRRDYERAIRKETGAILRVHPSNFQIIGFTESASVADLVAVAREHRVALVIDEGSGRVVPLERYGFGHEPTLRELIEAGVDVVTCSTDKLIGSIQGGLILGRREIVDRCARHPLMRALRPGKESFAVTLETLRAFLTEREEKEVALYRMLATPIEMLRARAESIVESSSAGEVVASESVLGGGTTPAETIPSIAIRLAGPASALHAAFRALSPSIVGRIESDRFLIDLRTVDPAEDPHLITGIRDCSG